MEQLNSREVMDVAEKLYYHVNPTTKMDVPNTAYIVTEKWYNEYAKSNSDLPFFKWCIENKK
jgi:hypothetical protein